mgnify:CR=1 FL=1
MPIALRSLIPVLLFAASVLLAEEAEEIFQIPYDQLDRYQASTHTVLAESTDVELTRITGKDDLVYDIIPGMVWDRQASNVSIAFVNRSAPLNRYEVLRLPGSAIEQDISPELIEAYLNGQALKLAEQGFEVVLPPEVNTGPARFRFLGRRALSFTYAFLKDEERVLRGENWVEIDGVLYIIAIEAPEKRFSNFFEMLRVAMFRIRPLN